jgi:hypothetical protein
MSLTRSLQAETGCLSEGTQLTALLLERRWAVCSSCSTYNA